MIFNFNDLKLLYELIFIIPNYKCSTIFFSKIEIALNLKPKIEIELTKIEKSEFFCIFYFKAIKSKDVKRYFKPISIREIRFRYIGPDLSINMPTLKNILALDIDKSNIFLSIIKLSEIRLSI